ncbi:T6SS immunity protein Tli4 family protein [Janthinobacterium sp.]|uniref:T6SS immunity protein Tli4 family protein n=1 Tax=Janthinobacterium sp. TaxID=1871054 RepID=UPI002623CBD1|nr:T6SS immunity protein Tli4 family protein [Janthinobacterium sp.]
MCKHRQQYVPFFAITFALILLSACSPNNAKYEDAMPGTIKLSTRLESLFLKTKLVCFGRYALEVPQEAQLISGGASFPSKITVTNGGIAARERIILEDIAKIKSDDQTAEIVYNGKGPIENSWQVRFFTSEFHKADGSLYFDTYITKGDITFILGDSIPEGGTVASAAARQMERANSLRLRDADEVPPEPGYCLEKGFMTDNLYNDQEMASAGLYFPSLPDVTFSISSNKDAYGDYPPAQFEKEMREELSLLKRIQGAKDIQGSSYPKRTLLREGKRDVQHWHGEESLIRRNDGVHDFEWALVGKPMDVAYPSEFSVHMYTKVEHNMVGAAKVASLNNDEAIALWDKLLSGLKFRVKVPGAPPGSYYIDPDKPAPAL